MAKKCEFRKKNGERCGADAQTGKNLCVFHDPARAVDGRRARKAGGIRRSQAAAVLPSDTPDHPLGNTKEVSAFLADSINQLRRGQLDPRVANGVGYLSSVRAWRDAWDELGGQLRVREVLDLWQAPIPEPWMRSEADTPKRLLSKRRYTLGNLNGIRKGEHEIEYEILVMHFDRAMCFGRPLLDGVNAYPLVKDSAGGRTDNVEADLVLLARRSTSAFILVSDVKKTDGNPFTALVQNLGQLRLFRANPACASVFDQRDVKTNVVQIRGGVIAPRTFYSSQGQKANSLPYARQLSESMLRGHKVKTDLLVWDPCLVQLYRYA
jgi:hypothetical protein